MLKVFVEGKELSANTVADAFQILKFIMPNKKAYGVDKDRVVFTQNMTLEEANAIVNPQDNLLESIPVTAKTVVKAKVKVTPKKTKKTVVKAKVKVTPKKTKKTKKTVVKAKVKAKKKARR